ncbi:cell pole-organizing protein PopZ [Sphingobium sp. B1D7B]|uniref:DUF2497 domain-containing protein n=1 Tax=unclassified Sphingobium TaxID=2611147 RepID=UPI0022250CED|nr:MULTISPECIES: DUF2497 domain-containing protein [unclassified Sphingobium]MCW2393206.1 cell pole-organizing protein PopZ [Sphingobium sp. B11D3A]MCW2405010.1 cell pole-organizing protein PopZ [Sphingobium sp. B1D7B]
MQNEPSMEEILSSIKRIIAEEDGLSATPRVPRRAAMANVSASLDDQILELTDALPGDNADGAESDDSHEEPMMSAPAKPAPAAVEQKGEPKSAESKSKATAKPRAAAASADGAPAVSTTASTLVSDEKARAARDSLVNLSRLLISPEDSQPNTVEGLVREMLRPMLKEWLDENLPGMVETMVKREIDRITGRV